MNEHQKERLREAIEDAVLRAREGGFTRDEVEDEVRYVLDNYDDEEN